MIYVEGKPDKVLLSAVGIASKHIVIAGNKGEVCNKLQKNKSVKGLVDEDPGSGQPSYIKSLAKVSEDKNLIEYQDKQRENKLVVIKPYLEEWVTINFRKSGVDLKEYFLPSATKELKRIINARLIKFENLIKDNTEIESLKKLKQFIND